MYSSNTHRSWQILCVCVPYVVSHLVDLTCELIESAEAKPTEGAYVHLL